MTEYTVQYNARHGTTSFVRGEAKYLLGQLIIGTHMIAISGYAFYLAFGWMRSSGYTVSVAAILSAPPNLSKRKRLFVKRSDLWHPLIDVYSAPSCFSASSSWQFLPPICCPSFPLPIRPETSRTRGDDRCASHRWQTGIQEHEPWLRCST